jgi:branched-chain amino acid transport system permease protein
MQPYLLASLGVVLSMLLCVFILRSKMGRGLAAVRMDLEAARAVGVRDFVARSQALMMSAALAGYFGGLYALTLGFLDPDTAFSLNWSVAPLLAVVLGGSGTLMGPVIGGAIWFGISEVITELGITSDTALILQGAILLGIALGAPRGLVGIGSSLWSRYRDRDGGDSGNSSDSPELVPGTERAASEVTR